MLPKGLRSGTRRHLYPLRNQRGRHLSTINIDVSTLLIVALIAGPALVFGEFTKFVYVLVIKVRHKPDLNANFEVQMPHKNLLTYTAFPLAFAGCIAFARLISFTPFENLESGDLTLILEPFWLLKYFAFALCIGTCGLVYGSVAALVVPWWLNRLGVGWVPERTMPQTAQPSGNRRNRNSGRNRR